MLPARNAASKSDAICRASRGNGPGSLNPYPARSYEHVRLVLDNSGCTRRQAAAPMPRPESKITVGVPAPSQCMAIRRPSGNLTKLGPTCCASTDDETQTSPAIMIRWVKPIRLLWRLAALSAMGQLYRLGRRQKVAVVHQSTALTDKVLSWPTAAGCKPSHRKQASRAARPTVTDVSAVPRGPRDCAARYASARSHSPREMPAVLCCHDDIAKLDRLSPRHKRIGAD
jgi:hypothetical protein